jgi:hypothetical protein
MTVIMSADFLKRLDLATTGFGGDSNNNGAGCSGTSERVVVAKLDASAQI